MSGRYVITCYLCGEADGLPTISSYPATSREAISPEDLYCPQCKQAGQCRWEEIKEQPARCVQCSGAGAEACRGPCCRLLCTRCNPYGTCISCKEGEFTT